MLLVYKTLPQRIVTRNRNNADSRAERRKSLAILPSKNTNSASSSRFK